MKLSFPIFNRAKRVVASAVTSMMMTLDTMASIVRANTWRDQYNPLRGLTMRRVVCLLEEGERGAYADLQWTYRFIEKRDATLRGGKRSLLGGLCEKGFRIAGPKDEDIPKGCTTEQRDQQISDLAAAYNRIDNMREAIEHLGLAEFRGYAHLEKHLAQDGPDAGQVAHLEPVEQWYFCRHGITGAWCWNLGARSGLTRGQEVDPATVICREIDDPIDEIALIAFVRKQLGRKDRDGYIESFGIPSIFLEMPQACPPGKEAEYQAIAEKIVSDARGALPFGAKVHVVAADGKGIAPFKEYLDDLDAEIVMAITSGMLTMLAESGSGTLAGGAHSETFDRVVRALARRVSEVFQEQFDKAFLAERFPGQPVMAWFEIPAEAAVNSSEFLADVKTASDAGYETDASQIEEETGLKVTAKQAAPQPGQPPSPVEPQDNLPTKGLRNRSNGNAAPAQDDAEKLAAVLGVKGSWISPVAAAWSEMLAKVRDESLTDAELLDYLDTFDRKLPELFGQMDVAGLRKTIAEAMGGAALEGAKDGLQQKAAKETKK